MKEILNTLKDLHNETEKIMENDLLPTIKEMIKADCFEKYCFSNATELSSKDLNRIKLTLLIMTDTFLLIDVSYKSSDVTSEIYQIYLRDILAFSETDDIIAEEQGLNDPIPKTIDASVELLYSEMTDKDKDFFFKVPEEDLICYHHTLGRIIRNRFRLWDKETFNPLMYDAEQIHLTEKERNEGKTIHPDDLSMKIIEILWHKGQN